MPCPRTYAYVNCPCTHKIISCHFLYKLVLFLVCYLDLECNFLFLLYFVGLAVLVEGASFFFYILISHIVLLDL